MENIKGKKLLILGGIRSICQIVEEAHKMGVTVYITDYLENSPAKKVADKSFMVSTTDVDAVVELCKREGIDGIFTGYIDSMLPYCEEACRRLGLPFWGNKDNVEMCIDKEKFKVACERSGLPVVPWKKANINNYKEVIKTVEMPVVIKPVDNSGSRGICKCYDRDDLISCCEKALSFSKKKEILIEKLMNANNEFSVYYMLYQGKAYFSAIGDRYVDIPDEDIAPVGKGMFYPSFRSHKWLESMDEFAQRFFKDNNMENGFVFMQGFEDNGELYMHEIGYRMNGGFTYKLIEAACGYNQVHQLIRYSLTGKMDEHELMKSDPFLNNGSLAFILTVSLIKGTITKIEGTDDINRLPGVLEVCQLRYEGETFNSIGTTANNFAFILCYTKSREELITTINNIKTMLKVYDENGNNMLAGIIDPDSIITRGDNDND